MTGAAPLPSLRLSVHPMLEFALSERETPLLDPVTPASVVDQLAERIRARILRNDFKPGEALRQEALADTYRVSRMPVREALRRLEVEGLVIFHPNRGVTVSDVSLDDMLEVFDLRRQLEPGLFAEAIRRASPEDIAAIDVIRVRETAALVRGDTASLGDLNREFHAALHAPARRPRTFAIVQSLNAHIDRYVRLQLSRSQAARRIANDEHERLLTAMRSGDDRAGSGYMTAHIDTARAALIEAFES